MRRVARLGVALLLVAVAASSSAVTSVPAGAETVGFRDFSYGTATAPTGQKPQSKLWFNDGVWWGSLFNAATTDFEIHRYDWPTHTWSTTGTLVDERQSAFMDALWDGSKLYVATAGPTVSNSGHQARIVRYSYDHATKRYTRDAGFPVNVTNAGVKAIVLAKDSAGTLWATYTQANKVWILRSTTSDAAWATPTVLPAPGASGIGTDELSAVVAYAAPDGNRVGVMWSNQVDSTMYWASHRDGAPADEWTQEIAYQRPEGADDHINLKSLQSDPAGRVFAAVKTSLDNSGDPLVHLLVLRPGGDWTSSVFGTVADDHTRAIVAIDDENRHVYVFASAPCCSGGVIYMKRASLDDLTFPAGRGTPFIASDTDVKINNPTTTKQNVSSASGLLVLASDDGTRYYLHNRLALDSGAGAPAPPPEPDTEITGGPSGTVASADATFTYRSTVSDSTFACSLDDAPFTACAAGGITYSGLAEGPHRFAVRATAGGVTDPSPATRTWAVDTTPAEVLLAEDFSGGFANWSPITLGDGQATIEGGADPYARFVATTSKNSLAGARHRLAAPRPGLVVDAAVRFTAEGTSGAVPVLRLFDESGARVVTVLRRSGSRGQLQVNYAGTTYNTSGALALGAPEAAVGLRLVLAGDGTWALELFVNGARVYGAPAAALGPAPVATVQIASDTKRQAFDATFDDVVIRESS